MDMLGNFARILMGAFNPFTPIFMIWGSIMGILLGLALARPRRNQVMKLQPNTNRGFDLSIRRENSIGLECEEIPDLPPQRFFKCYPGLTVATRAWTGRMQIITRWMAREGTAFTKRIDPGRDLPPIDVFKSARQLAKIDETLSKLEGGSQVLADPLGSPASKGDLDPNMMPISIAGFKWLDQLIPLNHAVRTIWGDTFWFDVPELQREMLEESRIGVTVRLANDPSPVSGKDGKPVEYSEENIKAEEDRSAAQTLWEGKEKAEKGARMDKVIYLVAGAGIGVIAALFIGWIPLGGKAATPAPVTTKMIAWVMLHVSL